MTDTFLELLIDTEQHCDGDVCHQCSAAVPFSILKDENDNGRFSRCRFLYIMHVDQFEYKE